MNRRRFIGTVAKTLGCLVVAPKALLAAQEIIVESVREPETLIKSKGGNTLLSPDAITKEALRILHNNLAFQVKLSGQQWPKSTIDKITIRKPLKFNRIS